MNDEQFNGILSESKAGQALLKKLKPRAKQLMKSNLWYLGNRREEFRDEMRRAAMEDGYRGLGGYAPKISNFIDGIYDPERDFDFHNGKEPHRRLIMKINDRKRNDRWMKWNLEKPKFRFYSNPSSIFDAPLDSVVNT